jgi:hypothetical protein
MVDPYGRFNRSAVLPIVILSLLAGCGTSGEEKPNQVQDVAAEVETLPADSAESPQQPPGCLNPGTEGATSRCLTPTHPEDYYIHQALLYFDTLDMGAPPENIPLYSELVARWEWPPWLLLTGYTATDMIEVGERLKVLDPSTVPVRDCRFFPVQPFARCWVEFMYEGGPCPIYEEFTFNDQGEMTFIEAWSDLPDLSPRDADGGWAETGAFRRLSTRVPGLGNETGRIDPVGTWMQQAAIEDPDVADFAMRATDWWTWLFDAFFSAPKDFFAVGCGWPTE